MPVDLLTVLGAQEFKRLPAPGAAPLGGICIDDTFLGLQMRTIPPPVTRPSRPLPPLAPPLGRPLPSRPFLRKGEPPFSDDEPNSNPLSVVTLSLSRATSAASSATRAFSPSRSARSTAAFASSSPARASARPARARQ